MGLRLTMGVGFNGRVLLLDLIGCLWRLQQQMGKKIEKQQQAPRTGSKRIIKKPAKLEQEQIFQDENLQESDQENSPHDDDSDSGFSDSEDNEDDGSDDEEQESESIPEIKPENLAVRNMQFRQKRGTKMNYLIARKKEEEEDPFWAQQGKNFFGDLDDGDNDEEDYIESSSGRDEFDSDFDMTESEHDNEQGPPQEKQVDEDREREKKKRQELMRKIEAPAPVVKKAVQRTIASSSATKKVQRVQSQKKLVMPESSSRYIHQLFNQQQLLGEAATTEYFNWLSLKKLISIETQRKDFTQRTHHVEGPKVIYRDRYNQAGERAVSYQLEGVVVGAVSDLTEMMREE